MRYFLIRKRKDNLGHSHAVAQFATEAEATAALAEWVQADPFEVVVATAPS